MAQTTKTKQLLSLAEISAYIPTKPCTRTIYRWVHSGKIPFIRFNNRLLFDRDVIVEWVANGGYQCER